MAGDKKVSFQLIAGIFQAFNLGHGIPEGFL